MPGIYYIFACIIVPFQESMVWPWAYSIWQFAGFKLAHGVFSALYALLVSSPAAYWIWTTYCTCSDPLRIRPARVWRIGWARYGRLLHGATLVGGGAMCACGGRIPILDGFEGYLSLEICFFIHIKKGCMS